MNTKTIGNITELKCLTAFVEQGFTVSIPYGDNARYDFIAELHGKLYKIQVKTSAQHDGYYVFKCRSAHSNSQGNKHIAYTSDEIDYFATMVGDECCLVQVGECSSEKRIRTEPPLNGQRTGITMVEDCALKNLIERGELG